MITSINKQSDSTEELQNARRQEVGVAAEAAPASFSPSAPTKEYIYAGGRLLAVEAPVGVSAAPVINSLSPTAALVGSTFTLTVNGVNLSNASALNINPATGVTVSNLSSTASQATATITISPSAATGARNISVTTPGGASGVLPFTINAPAPAPTLTTLSPTSAMPGSVFTLTLNGANLGNASAVNFNPSSGISVSNISASSSQVTALVNISTSAPVGAVNVSVTTPSGASNSLSFSVNAALPAPMITSLAPISALQGNTFTLTINGSNLLNASAVNFNPSTGVTISNLSSTANQVTATVSLSASAATGARTVSVTTPGGTSNTLPFTVNPAIPAPSLTSLAPLSAAQGSTLSLTLNGTNLANASAINFTPSTGITISNLSSSASQVTATVMIAASATTGGRTVSVTTPGGASNTLAFTVNPSALPPTISTLNPTSAQAGSSIANFIVNGSNLAGTSAMNFNPPTGIAVSGLGSSSTLAVATVSITAMAASGPRTVSVTTPGGTSNTLSFTVNPLPGAPIITALSPSSAAPGSSVMLSISGSNLNIVNTINFTPNTGITVNNISSNGNQVTASVSISSLATPGPRTVSVTTGAGTSNTLTFNIGAPANNPIPSLSSLSPSSVLAGSGAVTLMVNGLNFVSGAVVRVDGINRPTTFLSSSQLTTQLSSTDTASVGARAISVFNPAPGGGLSNILTFTIAFTPPAMPPAAPSNLSATAISSSQVNLSWQDNSTNEQGFLLKRQGPNDVSFVDIATLGVNVTTYSDTTVLANTTYTYRVRAFNANGNSPNSNDAAVTTPGGPPPPAAPTNLVATAVSGSQVTLSWQDNSTNEQGFLLKRKGPNDVGFVDLATLGQNVNTYVDTSVSPATLYMYRVRAFNANGNSANSNDASVTTPGGATPPAAPSNLMATAISSSQVNLSWQDNSNDEQGFLLKRQGPNDVSFVDIATLGPNVTTYTDTNVSANTTYTYRVRAFNANGNSVNSNDAAVTTPGGPPPPAAPSNLAATPVSSTRIRLTWRDNSNDEQGFTVRRKGPFDADFVTAATVLSNTTIFTDTNLLPGTTYAYRIRAFNANGGSGSNEASATTFDAFALQAESATKEFVDADAAALAAAPAGAAATSSASGSITDNTTPLGVAPGAPAGAFALSDFDNINPYNGNLNFRLPLLTIAGRGAAQTMMMLALNTKSWRVDASIIPAQGIIYTPMNEPWSDLEVGYGPGVLVGRLTGIETIPCGPSGETPVPRLTLTRLTFIGPDGSETELRDTLTGGSPLATSCANPTPSRGTTFVSANGSAVTFVADAPIVDAPGPGRRNQSFPSGVLRFRDGMRYRIENGLVTRMRDRNGNRLDFTYDAQQRVSTIVDSLNRSVTVNYNVSDIAPYSLCDQIIFKGFGGAQRILRISKTPLGSALRPNSGFSIKTDQQLFPELPAGPSVPSTFNPQVASSVWLPDGRRYRFYYNDYGEVARVDLPTGGAIEYDSNLGSGVMLPVQGEGFEVFRRVRERRVYPDGVSLESKQRFSLSFEGGNTLATIDFTGASGERLASEKHYYYGSAVGYLFSYRDEYFIYPAWTEGKEYQTELIDADGVTVLRQLTSVYQQREPVSWWPGFVKGSGGRLSLADEPPNDTRLIRSVTALPATNQVARQTFNYDRYNNKTEVSEFDYGPGSAGPLLRRTRTDYLTVNAVNGGNYSDGDIHLRDLPTQQSVFDGDGVERARSTYEYDNYSADGLHAPLVDRPQISGFSTGFTPAYQTRGNLTRIAVWLLPGGTQLSTHKQYDIAGNVVKSIDARGNATLFSFNDRFGSPNGEARSNTAPIDLLNQVSYAFPTQVTNALGHTSYTQYDFYLGRPVDSEDANGVVTSAYFNDILDRPTLAIMAVNTAASSQTRFTYNDAARSVTTAADLNTQGDNLLKREDVYDGLGRPIEKRVYETSAQFTAMKQTYDGMGRIRQDSNPYRPGSEPLVWNTYQYDGLGRRVSVTTPDGARSLTAYLGNQVTSSDPAGKVKRSVTDALGRVTRLIEDPDGLAYQTNYVYDALDNLTSVAQGLQMRTFTLDAAGRLTRAVQPESGQLQYEYDANGNVLRRTDARGIATNYAYDALNRVTAQSHSDNTPAITFTYDAPTAPFSKGRPTAFSSSVSTYRVDEYAPAGQVKRSTQLTDGQTYSLSYTYNLAGKLTAQTLPSGRIIAIGYDTSGRINQITGQKPGEAIKTYTSSVTYTAHGALAGLRLGNGLWEHQVFNTRLQLTELGLGSNLSDSSVLQLTYAYGTLNNNDSVLAQTIRIGATTFNQTYSYDAVNRLSAATEAGNWNQNYLYDQYGNRAVTGYVPNPTLTPQSLSAFNASTNRLIASQYDAAGNQIRDAAGDMFAYDAENRLLNVNNGEASYSYDGRGKRVKKVAGAATVFVYNAEGKLMAEYSDAAQPGAGGISYVSIDALTSPRVVTDGNGAVKGRHDYLPFGEELSAGVGARTSALGYGLQDNLHQKFTQKERDDETGLDFFGARYYSSPQGRWTTPDPYLPSGQVDVPQSWNRYTYVLNNPLALVDPLGLENRRTFMDYDELEGRSKELFDEFARRRNAMLGTAFTPQQVFQLLSQTERATFSAITFALMNQPLTSEDKKKPFDGNIKTALDLVESISIIAGEIKDARGDQQFRLFVNLRAGSVGILNQAKEFGSGRNRAGFHEGFPLSFREKGGVPNLQISTQENIPANQSIGADIDIDFKGNGFFNGFFGTLNGHFTADNSNVLASDNAAKLNREFGNKLSGKKK
ncbi:MAG TPA: fibronectin type III domain-containing protein [Anaerolineae bacterium]|nr:fibronectin type III domain-containing protein [Anaerolineae bacterium]